MNKYMIASGFAPFSPCADRFNPSGYREPFSLEEQFEAASKIDGLTGLGLDYPYQFKSAKDLRPLLKKRHSLVAGENPAEAAVLLHRAGKPFQVHINDNFRDWDHDLIAGSVTFWETLEFFYWLRRCGWEVWYILDIFPYRVNGHEALQMVMDRARFFIELSERLDSQDFRGELSCADVIATGKRLWKLIFGA